MMVIVVELSLVEGKMYTALVVGKEKDTTFPWEKNIGYWILVWGWFDGFVVTYGVTSFSVGKLLLLVVNVCVCILFWNGSSVGFRHREGEAINDGAVNGEGINGMDGKIVSCGLFVSVDNDDNVDRVDRSGEFISTSFWRVVSFFVGVVDW